MYLFAQPPLRPNAKTIPDQQHPDQQLRINPLSCIFNALPGNGRAAGVAVETREMRTDAAQVDETVNRPQ
jgi:hypothetical protein